MKTSTVFVLMAFIILGMEMAYARRRPPGGGDRPGRCPKVPHGSGGICAEMCSGDNSCPRGMKCCSNGCGHVCLHAIRVDDVEDYVDDPVEEEWGV